MNKRIFLFGVGIGIMIGAALLQLMLIGEKQVNVPDPLTQDISEPLAYSQEELDKAVADERKRVEDELKQQQQLQKEAASAKKDKESAAKSTVVRIPPNSNITETADQLEAKGVISDKQAFIDLMRNTKIRAGYFAFKAGLSMDQVRNVITSKPNSSEADMPASGQ
ncbi:endolytic transglycosylase MltG [Paenibacillus montanisoli]|uniref:Uncharacterized protein n=1 Tax=Paenibacillus montanisoli TaxID=2081970 RepID=A0A328U800_9BACL|nr:endolytic transglycosylase MltG [Paenibacillus montanisoli]RAP76234.1 hypothetical protein DL346_12565 [Paenibacillus montanisoli]